MAEQWYYAQQGQRKGPVSEEQIRQMISSGQIQPTDSVWKQGMAQWTQASQILSSPSPRKAAEMWSRLSTIQKLLGIGGIVAIGFVLLSCMGILGKGAKKHDAALSQWEAASESIDVALAKADQQWDAGKKAEAVDGYLSLISGQAHTFRLGHSRDLPRLYRRVIDYQVEKAGPESARELIRDALRKNVVLTLSSPEANAIVAEERPAAEQEIAKEAERRDKRRHLSRTENVSDGNGNARNDTDEGMPENAGSRNNASASYRRGHHVGIERAKGCLRLRERHQETGDKEIEKNLFRIKQEIDKATRENAYAKSQGADLQGQIDLPLGEYDGFVETLKKNGIQP